MNVLKAHLEISKIDHEKTRDNVKLFHLARDEDRVLFDCGSSVSFGWSVGRHVCNPSLLSYISCLGEHGIANVKNRSEHGCHVAHVCVLKAKHAQTFDRFDPIAAVLAAKDLTSVQKQVGE